MSRPSRRKPGSPHAAIATGLVTWYRAHRRDLPWRQTRDPYAIWISEIMLQQTRVAAVIPYWQAWMQRFGSLQALAQAPLDDVLAHWAGLGYYSRARNLKRGAELIVARFGGQMPTSAVTLREVPGIGPYTAGAIASIAFAERVPLVDGNVARVFARVFALAANIKATAAQKELWIIGAALMAALPTKMAPGDLNQALMELGATVCTPTSPKCGACPVSASCQALAGGLVEQLPVMPKRRRGDDLQVMARVALWIVQEGRVLFARRRPEGLYGGLWELPQGEALAAAKDVLAGKLRVGEEIATHRQDLTHRRLQISVRDARLVGSASASTIPALGKTEAYDQLAWMSPTEARTKGIATSTATLLAHLEGRVI